MLPSLYIKGPNVLFLFNTALAFEKKNGILNMVSEAELITLMWTITMMMMVYIWRIKGIYIMLYVEAQAHLNFCPMQSV